MTYKKAVTVASLIDEADAASALAARCDQPSAMIAAAQFKAKLVGLMVDRKELGSPGDFANLQNDKDILAKARQEHGADFAAALAAALAKLDQAKPEPDKLLALPHPDDYPMATHDAAHASADES